MITIHNEVKHMKYDKPQLQEQFDAFESRMDKSLTNLQQEFMSMKAGRANPHILDKVVVNYYGTPTPIKQLANISTPEARLLVISPWDVSALKDMEKAIIAANLGVTPNNDGKMIRLIFPELTQERRKELVKTIRSVAESTKVTLRNARRDINETLKKFKKDAVITEDELSACEKDVDKLLAEQIDCVDRLVKDKEVEVTTV